MNYKAELVRDTLRNARAALIHQGDTQSQADFALREGIAEFAAIQASEMPDGPFPEIERLVQALQLRLSQRGIPVLALVNAIRRASVQADAMVQLRERRADAADAVVAAS